MRFTATLAETGTETGGGGSNLYRRSAKALADLTGSPAALLMLPDAQGSFRIAETWQWPDALDPGAFSGEAALPLRCAFTLQETQHIVDLDALRRGSGLAADELAISAWWLAERGAWVVVPQVHFQRIIEEAVLQRPIGRAHV